MISADRAAGAAAAATSVGDGGLRPGMRVCIQGLQARPELNGLQGELSEYVTAEERWRVVMDDGSGKCLKAANLSLCGPVKEMKSGGDGAAPSGELKAGARVRISGLVARAELNGKQGTLHEFDAAEGRWRVVMDDNS